MSIPKNPIQPLHMVGPVLRFKENKIVRYILENGGIDLNQIAAVPFSKDDRQQFAQLIGYSLSGYGDLSYVDELAWDTANRMHEHGLDEKDAKIAYYEEIIKTLKEQLCSPMALLFEKHPNDLLPE